MKRGRVDEEAKDEGIPMSHIYNLSVEVLGACLQPLSLHDRLRTNRVSKFFSAACHTAVAWQTLEDNEVFVNNALELARVVISTVPFPHISLFENVTVTDLMLLRTVRLEPQRTRLISLHTRRADFPTLVPELILHTSLRHVTASAVDAQSFSTLCQHLPQVESVSVSLTEPPLADMVLSPRLRSLVLDDMQSDWLPRCVNASWSGLHDLYLAAPALPDMTFDLRCLSACRSLSVLRLGDLQDCPVLFWPFLPHLHELAISVDSPDTRYEGLVVAFPNLRVLHCHFVEDEWLTEAWRVLVHIPIVELALHDVQSPVNSECWSSLPHLQVLHLDEINSSEWECIRRACPRLHTLCLSDMDWSDNAARAQFSSHAREAGFKVRWVY